MSAALPSSGLCAWSASLRSVAADAPWTRACYELTLQLAMFRRVLPRYFVPILTVGCASALSFFIVRAIGPGPWIGYAYLFAIMGAAWRGGYGPGLIACVMSFCLTPFLFNPNFNLARADLNR